MIKNQSNNFEGNFQLPEISRKITRYVTLDRIGNTRLNLAKRALLDIFLFFFIKRINLQP